MIGHVTREYLPASELQLLRRDPRVYNRYGRRDNLWKARIKILVKELTPADSRGRSSQWAQLKTAPARFRGRDHAPRRAPSTRLIASSSATTSRIARPTAGRSRWVERNVRAHKRRGYAIVTLSLKRTAGRRDVTASEMDAIAALADRYSFGEVRVTHGRTCSSPTCCSRTCTHCGRSSRRSGSRRRTSGSDRHRLLPRW
jgi:sulfite reductase (NADPH) hemoprotein beta-component